GDPDYLVSGDPRTPSEAEEVWTFVRRPGAAEMPFQALPIRERLARPAVSIKDAVQRGRAKVFLKVVRRAIALTAVSDRSAGHGHCEGANRRNVLNLFNLAQYRGRVE